MYRESRTVLLLIKWDNHEGAGFNPVTATMNARTRERWNMTEKVLMLGFGAVGITFASQFADAGYPITILCDDARKRRYAAEPTVVNGRTYAFPFVTAQEVTERPDVIFVAVKAYDLETVLPDLKAVTGPETTVLSLLNGISSEEIIGRAVGPEKVVPAFVTHMDSNRDGRSLAYTSSARIVYGEADGSRSERIRRLERLFSEAGVVALAVDDVRKRQWAKFMFNVGINQVGAVVGGPYGTFQSCPEARSALLDAMAEVVALAPHCGVDLTDGDVEEALLMLDSLDGEGKNSMLQDREAKRKTEVDLFAGEICRLGERFGVPTPVNALLFRMIRTLEWQYR